MIVDAQTNSNEAPQVKKRLPRPLLIAIIEVSMVLGCMLAMFIAPSNTPLLTFLIICGVALILGNVLLFRSLKKPVDPSRETKKTLTSNQIPLTSFCSCY